MLASRKLIDLVADKAEVIARQWAKDATCNPRTPFYSDLTEDEAMPQAINFYQQFTRIFTSKAPYDAIKQFIYKYAEARFTEGVPLHEAIYSIILMRRHIWLYAEFQGLFISIIEQQQAMDSLNRTILMFDYVVYLMSEKYGDLKDREKEKEKKKKP